MKMEKMELSDNHRRAIASSLLVIEKSINELESKLLPSADPILYRIIKDNDSINIQHYFDVIGQIRSSIQQLFVKYKLKYSEVSLNQIINAKKTSMWEVLCETTSKRLNGYGEFPKEYAAEFDKDIDRLQELIKKI